jgi:protein SCO1/2
MDVSHAPGAEREFAARVAALAYEPPGDRRTAQLLELLREDADVYRQRGSAAAARMRGWVLIALARATLPEAAMLHVIEELDNGRSPYLVAAAARALRSAASPTPVMAAFVMQALVRVRDHDEYVDLDVYGGATIDRGTTALAELLATLRWLGARAGGLVAELEALRRSADRPLTDDEADDVQRTLDVIRACVACAADAQLASAAASACCVGTDLWGAFRHWLPGASRDTQGIEFEDQDGARVAYREFFSGRPAVVVFFYTRCDNAQKCSLTISKLARVQQLLQAAGMDARIRTAAITYDATYDLPGRLRGYAQSRGVTMSGDHRVMRTVTGERELHAHFRLGVNFVASLVNRHRIETYLVDSQGRIAASFERIRWDERRVVEEAMKLLDAAPAGDAQGGALGAGLPRSDASQAAFARMDSSHAAPVRAETTAWCSDPAAGTREAPPAAPLAGPDGEGVRHLADGDMPTPVPQGGDRTVERPPSGRATTVEQPFVDAEGAAAGRQAAAKQVAAEQAAARQVATPQAAAQQAAAQQATAQQAAEEGAAEGQAAAEQVPAEQVPAEQTPAEQTPAEQTAAQQTAAAQKAAPGHAARTAPSFTAVEGPALRGKAEAPKRRGDARTRTAMSPMLALAIALFPKCPLCGATYLSASAMAAMPYLPPVYWLFPALLVLTLANIASLGFLAWARRRWEGWSLALAGAACLLVFGVAHDQAWGLWTGIALSLAGSLAGVMLPARGRAAALTRIPMRERVRRAVRFARMRSSG